MPRLSSNFTISLFDVFILRARGMRLRISLKSTFERSIVAVLTDMSFGMSKRL